MLLTSRDGQGHLSAPVRHLIAHRVFQPNTYLGSHNVRKFGGEEGGG